LEIFAPMLNETQLDCMMSEIEEKRATLLRIEKKLGVEEQKNLICDFKNLYKNFLNYKTGKFKIFLVNLVKF